MGEEALNFIDWIDVCCASSQGLAPYVVPKTGVRYPTLYSYSCWLGSKIQDINMGSERVGTSALTVAESQTLVR